MNFSALKNIIGAVAPTLGTALAGPLGGTAAKAISAVLGCKSDAKSIETAMQAATPEQLLEIKKAELAHEKPIKATGHQGSLLSWLLWVSLAIFFLSLSSLLMLIQTPLFR